MFRQNALLLAFLTSLLVPTSAVLAQTTVAPSVVGQAADALASDPVFVHPESGVSDADAEQLREEIADADAGPIYIAILPSGAASAAGGDAGELLVMIGTALDRPGTYALVVGEELVAGATERGTPFEPGTVPRLADEAVSAGSGEGAAAVLFDFVGRLDDEAAGRGEEPGPGFSALPLLLIGGGVGAFLFVRRRRREREEQRQLEEVRELAMDDLVALGDDLRALDLDVEMPGADPAAKQDYVVALESYERASADLDRARRPGELGGVTTALEEGRYAMASAKARLEGREPPERRAPCFFDPRHGPSERDVGWAPPGGAERAVPACAADARRVDEGDEPMTREITVAGRRRPYWDAPPYYGGWAGGYFGGFGLFEGMLLGSILSGGFGAHSGAGDGGSGGWGDFGAGGGDFGGGGD
ncbi:MAG: hypothetical protein ABR529_07035 [Actinomycetota bacterium]